MQTAQESASAQVQATLVASRTELASLRDAANLRIQQEQKLLDEARRRVVELEGEVKGQKSTFSSSPRIEVLSENTSMRGEDENVDF